MNYVSIQTLIDIFQESKSFLPLLSIAWQELNIIENLKNMGITKHHGTPFHENVCHLSYLPFINASSINQLSDNLSYHQRGFTYLWDMVKPMKWWQLITSVSDEILFHQARFPNIGKDGMIIIDDTSMEKFGINMENISGVRTAKGRIGIGHVAFLACVHLPEITIPIACRPWVPSWVSGYESKVSMAIATVKHFARQARKSNLNIAGIVVAFDSWYFAAELCKIIAMHHMIWITQSKSNRIFYLADQKGNPTIKMRASDFIAQPKSMKLLNRKGVWYRNVGRCYLPKFGWVYATVVCDPKRNPEAFLLVSNNLRANGPWMMFEAICKTLVEIYHFSASRNDALRTWIPANEHS